MSNVKRTPSGDPVIARIEELLKTQRKTKRELTDYIGINNTNFSMWKYENSKSYMKYIKKIADFLGVSMYALLEGQSASVEVVSVSDSSEIKLIQCLGNFDSHKKELMLDLAETLSR